MEEEASADSEVIRPSPVAERAPAAPEPPSLRAPRRGGALALLIALIALVLAGFAVWRVIAIERGQGNAQAALRNELDARTADIARSGDQRKRDLDALRSRIADTDTVNKGVREELLALGERSRHLEDAVANLAEQR